MKIASEISAAEAIRQACAQVGVESADRVIRLACQALAQDNGGSAGDHKPVVSTVCARDFVTCGPC